MAMAVGKKSILVNLCVAFCDGIIIFAVKDDN